MMRVLFRDTRYFLTKNREPVVSSASIEFVEGIFL